MEQLKSTFVPMTYATQVKIKGRDMSTIQYFYCKGFGHYASNCSKKFPKQIRNQTTFEENGIINYKRRDTKNLCRKRNIKLDNRFVVPYNRELSLSTYKY